MKGTNSTTTTKLTKEGAAQACVLRSLIEHIKGDQEKAEQMRDRAGHMGGSSYAYYDGQSHGYQLAAAYMTGYLRSIEGGAVV